MTMANTRKKSGQDVATLGINPDELPRLTEKQRKFCDGIINGMTASDAYRQAYDCGGSKPQTIWDDAAKLRTHPKIVQWMKAARLAGMMRTQCSIDEHLSELERLRDAAEATGNYGAAVQAEQLRGKVRGYYVDQVKEIGSAKINPGQAIRQLAALVGNEAAIKAAVERLGYTQVEIYRILGVSTVDGVEVQRIEQLQ